MVGGVGVPLPSSLGWGLVAVAVVFLLRVCVYMYAAYLGFPLDSEVSAALRLTTLQRFCAPPACIVAGAFSTCIICASDHACAMPAKTFERKFAVLCSPEKSLTTQGGPKC